MVRFQNKKNELTDLLIMQALRLSKMDRYIYAPYIYRFALTNLLIMLAPIKRSKKDPNGTLTKKTFTLTDLLTTPIKLC